jgi:hypothetical protein
MTNLKLQLKKSNKMAEAKKNERFIPPKKVKELCKEFGFTTEMFEGSLAKGGRLSNG